MSLVRNFVSSPSAIQSALALPRESVMPGVRSWERSPLASLWLGVVTDSTGASPDYWPRRVANRIAAAHPELTVRACDWAESPARMVPTTIQIGSAGERYLSSSNSAHTLFTEIHSGQTVTGDIAVHFDFLLPSWTPASSVTLGYAMSDGGAKVAFLIQVRTDGKLNFQWFPDNTVSSLLSRTSTVATGWTAGTRHRGKVYLDVDNGSGGHDVKFYETSDGGATYTAIGSTITTAGTTSIGAGWPTQVYVGSPSGLPTGVRAYCLNWARGENGAPLAPPLDQWARSDNSIVTASGSPELTIYNAAKGGADYAYWTSPYLQTALPYALSGVLVSLGHNYYQLNQAISGIQVFQDALVTRMRTATLAAAVVVMTQNPKGSANPLSVQQCGLIANQLQAARASGLGVLDAYGWFRDSAFPDTGLQEGASGTHPTNAWQTKWGDFVYSKIFTPAQL